jgi:hypothetical protein
MYSQCSECTGLTSSQKPVKPLYIDIFELVISCRLYPWSKCQPRQDVRSADTTCCPCFAPLGCSWLVDLDITTPSLEFSSPDCSCCTIRDLAREAGQPPRPVRETVTGLYSDEDPGLCYGIFIADKPHRCPYADRPSLCRSQHHLDETAKSKSLVHHDDVHLLLTGLVRPTSHGHALRLACTDSETLELGREQVPSSGRRWGSEIDDADSDIWLSPTCSVHAFAAARLS